MTEVLCRRPAMATLFEFILVGDDEEHLEVVGEAALDEVVRIEQMISIFDPTSELSRINREAFWQNVGITGELHDILRKCLWHHEWTSRWFDPCHGGPVPYGEAIRFVDDTRFPCRIRLSHPAARIDLGGYGKGYALDAARQLIDRFGVYEFLLHGGTSSVLACGERKWPVDLRSPNGDRILGKVELCNASLTCSANATDGTVVISEKAEVGEKWSTAILAAGRERMHDFNYHDITAAAWLDTDIHWIVDRRT